MGKLEGDLRYRPLMTGERLAGFWEYDPDTDEIVTSTFEPLSRGRKAALDDDCERLGAFIRDDLGHARSFSLDTDEAVRGRAAAIRSLPSPPRWKR